MPYFGHFDVLYVGIFKFRHHFRTPHARKPQDAKNQPNPRPKSNFSSHTTLKMLILGHFVPQLGKTCATLKSCQGEDFKLAQWPQLYDNNPIAPLTLRGCRCPEKLLVGFRHFFTATQLPLDLELDPATHTPFDSSHRAT
jgi:hypothetical protein